MGGPPPATCSRSRRRRCPCPSSSPAWTPPSGARGAAISATVAIRRAGGPSGSPSPRRRRQRGRFPHRRRPIIRPRRAVPVLGGGLCGGSKWFPPGSRSPPRRDPRCSPRKDEDLLYPAIHSPTELLSYRGRELLLCEIHAALHGRPGTCCTPMWKSHPRRFKVFCSPPVLLALYSLIEIRVLGIYTALQGRTGTCSTP